jgi:hypothetical protein
LRLLWLAITAPGGKAQGEDLLPAVFFDGEPLALLQHLGQLPDQRSRQFHNTGEEGCLWVRRRFGGEQCDASGFHQTKGEGAG